MSACGGGGGGSSAGPGSPPAAASEPPLAIAAQPQPVSALAGDTARFSVTVSGGASLSYQWQKNGVDIAGATGASYTTPALSLADSGASYGVKVSSASASISSQAVTLTVTAVTPAIDAQPVSVTALAGGSVSFSVHATGTAPLSYQWYRSGIAIPDATSPSLTIESVRYADDASAYTVDVGNPAGTVRSQAAILGLKTASNATTIGACTEITRSGSYRLGQDIASGADAMPCVAIHDVHDVQLDCDGHRIVAASGSLPTALDVRNVSNFSIRNCTLNAAQIQIVDSDMGSFSHNIVSPSTQAFPSLVIDVHDSSAIVFDNNTITGVLQQRYSVANTVSNNQLSVPALQSSAAGLIISSYGTHDRIVGNTIDGAWPGSACCTGSDDGVILEDNEDAVIEGNTIANVWDCGIEWVGTQSHTTIRNNHIANAANCGIGGWYWASLSDAVIANNTVERAGSLLTIFRDYGLRPAGTDPEHKLPADTAVVVKNNLFIGNMLSKPTSPSAATFRPYNGPGTTILSSLPGEREPLPTEYQITNNIFKDNQFSTDAEGPSFAPKAIVPDAVVDGGGNQCRTPPNQPDYPLKCQ